jgi:hypothetical protein
MRITKLSLIAAVLVVPASTQVSTNDAALRTLRHSHPTVGWNAKSAIMADVDCDGKPDTIVFGSDKDKVAIGVVSGASPGKPQVFFFPKSSNAQGGFCASPVRIETSQLECESPVGALPGCKPLKECRAFSVIDDECDPFNFYWDSSRKSLAWWRN